MCQPTWTWALPSTDSAPLTLTLNGKALPPAEPHQFLHELDELEPRTRYSVDFAFEVYGGVLVHDQLSFTRGDGPGEADPGAAPERVTWSRRSLRSASQLCKAILFRDTCFDTGPAPDVAYEYEPRGSAQAWIFQYGLGGGATKLWPAECGAPLDLHPLAAVGGRSCVTLSGIDATGAAHAGPETCTQTRETDSVSCGLALPSRSAAPAWVGLSLLACFGLRRRGAQASLISSSRSLL